MGPFPLRDVPVPSNISHFWKRPAPGGPQVCISSMLLRLFEGTQTKEVFEGETVWEGVVQVFDLIDHPKAKRCYAWSHGLDKSKKRRFFAVLHEGPVDSAEKAVRAAIVNEAKRGLTQ